MIEIQSYVGWGRSNRTAGARWVILAMALIGCAGLRGAPRPIVDIEYSADQGVVRAHNRTGSILRIYYGDVRQPRNASILLLRFRDHEARILNVGLAGGWFTPAIYSSQIYPQPMRAELAIPADSFVDLELDLTQFARSVNSDAGRGAGPCEVQIGLFGFLEDDESRRVEARTEWMPGPCPGHPQELG